MIVAVIPFWSDSDMLNQDSNYAFLVRVLPVMARLRPDWAWVLFWPKQYGADTWKWVDDGILSSIPNLAFYGWAYDTAMASSVSGWDAIAHRDLERKFAPMVYWLHQVESGVFLAGGYRRSFCAVSHPVLVAQHHYIIHRSLPYPMNFNRLWLQMGGSLASDIVVCNSQHTLTMMREAFAEWLNQDTLDSLLAKTIVHRFGLLDPTVFPTEIRPYPKPVFVYNHRQENYKQPHVTQEVLSSLRASGLDFEVWLTRNIGQRSIIIADRYMGHPDYRQYLQNIAIPAINTINSVHETFCISAMDSLALGHLLVAPRGVTFPELVPPDYPFLFRSAREQTEMLRHILTTWPTEWEKWSPILRRFAREQFDIVRYAETYAEIIASTWKQKYEAHTMKPAIAKRLDEFCQRLAPGEYSFSEIRRKMRAALGVQDQAFPPHRIASVLWSKGFRFRISQAGIAAVKEK